MKENSTISFLTDHAPPSTPEFPIVPWNPISAMIGAKRRRYGSVDTTQSLNPSHSQRKSSSAQSTPIHQSRHQKHSSQRPTKRVSLRPPTVQLGSEGLSSQQHYVATHPRVQAISSSEGEIRSEDESVIEEREDADSLNEVIMCVDMRDRGTVGCCYYVARDQKLYIMADVTYVGVEVIETCELSHSSLQRSHVAED